MLGGDGTRLRNIFLILMLILTVIPLEYVVAGQGSVVVVAPNKWVHLSLDGEPITSLGWVRYGVDIQVSFYAFNDSGVQFDSFVIVVNQSFQDPFKKFVVLWGGTYTNLGELVLTVSSPLGIATTVVQQFPGEVPRYGKPAMTVRKTVITEAGKLYDVVVDDKHVASFDWSFVTLENNQSFPQLKVYKNDGVEYDTKVLTVNYVPLVDYYDVVGWMTEAVTGNWVKWILYSGKPIQVRLSQGFASTSLPFFIIYPRNLQAEVGQMVTVQWVLPGGVTTYSVSWSDSSMELYFDVVNEEFDPSSGEFLVELAFRENAEGKRFMLQVEAVKYGTTYRSGDYVLVLAPAWKTMALPVVSGVAFLLIIVVLILLVWRRRVTPVDSRTALRKTAEDGAS